MDFAAAILEYAEIWAWIGAAVAAVFLTVGIDRIDENARGAYVFRRHPDLAARALALGDP